MRTGTYRVMVYNDLDALFGYDAGAQVYMDNLTKAVANSIVRHLNKATPDFVCYFVDGGADRDDE